jgi:hypothetical protein
LEVVLDVDESSVKSVICVSECDPCDISEFLLLVNLVDLVDHAATSESLLSIDFDLASRRLVPVYFQIKLEAPK